MFPSMLRAAIITLSLVALSGCVNVMPWERERLARPDMQFDGAEELNAADAHATDVREGSAGGFDASGGGCGCN